jgi:hypothetical protein
MTREEAMADGYIWFCLGCNKAYKKKPTEQYEDGHGGRQLEMCSCGCDLFARFDDDSLWV